MRVFQARELWGILPYICVFPVQGVCGSVTKPHCADFHLLQHFLLHDGLAAHIIHYQYAKRHIIKTISSMYSILNKMNMHSKCTYIFVNRLESIIHGLPVLCIDHVHGQSGRSQLGLPCQCQCEHIRHGQRPHCLAFCLHDGQNSNIQTNVTSMFLYHSLCLIRSVFLSLFLQVFGGFLVNLNSMLNWLSWLKWASIFKYGLDVRRRKREINLQMQKVLLN